MLLLLLLDRLYVYPCLCGCEKPAYYATIPAHMRKVGVEKQTDDKLDRCNDSTQRQHWAAAKQYERCPEHQQRESAVELFDVRANPRDTLVDGHLGTLGLCAEKSVAAIVQWANMVAVLISEKQLQLHSLHQVNRL